MHMRGFSPENLQIRLVTQSIKTKKNLDLCNTPILLEQMIVKLSYIVVVYSVNKGR